MGSCCETIDDIPQELHKIPKDQRNIDFRVAYWASWGGPAQADFAKRAIEIVFPNSRINATPDGPPSTVEVRANNRKLYNSQEDGYICNSTAVGFIEKIKARLWDNYINHGKHMRNKQMNQIL